MHSAITLLVFFLPFILCGQFIPPSDPNIRFSGRVTPTYNFEWSGVEITTAFTGTSIEIILEDYDNMYNVFIDGTFVLWLNTTGGLHNYTLATGLANTKHVFQLTKRTEAFYGVVTFGGLVLDEGASLLPYPALDRRIEFIGDSITCGYGDLGHYPCSFAAATEDNYVSYGPLTARALNAELHLEAWSGLGMVRNYGDKNSTSVAPFPTLYPYVLPSTRTGEWNFSQWVPHAVVINLGTNDFSTQPWPAAEVYEQAYVNFIGIYSKLYNPAPKFFLVCGPMQDSATCPFVQSVANTTGATYIDLENILVFPTDFGCDYHPAVTGHAKMANKTIAVVQAVLGW